MQAVRSSTLMQIKTKKKIKHNATFISVILVQYRTII